MTQNPNNLGSTTLPENFAGQVELRTSFGEQGSVSYKIFQGDNSKPPVFIVPGFPLGTTQLDNFAATLNRLGNRTVISPNEIDLKGFNAPTVEKEADLYLGIIQREGLADSDVQVVTHSYGAAVFSKMAEQADNKIIGCFKGEHSRVVMIAPVGTTSEEKFPKLAKRLGRFLKTGVSNGIISDVLLAPSRPSLYKENIRTIVAHPWKTAGEIRAIKKTKLDFEKLGQLACSPDILIYPVDPMFGESVPEVKEGIEAQAEHIAGVSMPVRIGENLAYPYASETWSYKNGLRTISRSSHLARHDELIMDPESTAGAVLNCLEPDRLLKNID
ncbi:alpha/beta hydrolase [Candidatus Saccharibacteria bacterium]|nr:alpha/beta hydrolase [Candidatus Saccharibacteria bacterium]